MVEPVGDGVVCKDVEEEPSIGIQPTLHAGQ